MSLFLFSHFVRCFLFRMPPSLHVVGNQVISIFNLLLCYYSWWRRQRCDPQRPLYIHWRIYDRCNQQMIRNRYNRAWYTPCFFVPSRTERNGVGLHCPTGNGIEFSWDHRVRTGRDGVVPSRPVEFWKNGSIPSEFRGRGSHPVAIYDVLVPSHFPVMSLGKYRSTVDTTRTSCWISSRSIFVSIIIWESSPQCFTYLRGQFSELFCIEGDVYNVCVVQDIFVTCFFL